MTRSESVMALTWRRFRRSRLATASLVYVVLVTLAAIAAPMIAGSSGFAVPFDPNATDLVHRLAPPGGGHPFGTDDLGRDVLSRMIHGARVSLAVGFAATLISLIVGSFLGALAGYYGGARR